MKLKLNKQGLIPAVILDAETGKVLTLAYMNRQSLKRTLESGQVWFYSRSRQKLWHKGEESGNYLNVKKMHLDCDQDSILITVQPTGPACHTGNSSCFFTTLEDLPESFEYTENDSSVLQHIFDTIQDRAVEMPEGSYTVDLLKGGTSRIAQKVIEEAGETALAASQGDSANLPNEVADLLYHTLVLLSATGVSLQDVWKVLEKRRK